MAEVSGFSSATRVEEVSGFSVAQSIWKDQPTPTIAQTPESKQQQKCSHDRMHRSEDARRDDNVVLQVTLSRLLRGVSSTTYATFLLRLTISFSSSSFPRPPTQSLPEVRNANIARVHQPMLPHRSKETDQYLYTDMVPI